MNDQCGGTCFQSSSSSFLLISYNDGNKDNGLGDGNCSMLGDRYEAGGKGVLEMSMFFQSGTRRLNNVIKTTF